MKKGFVFLCCVIQCTQALTLKEVVYEAIAHSPNLKAARATQQNSQFKKDQVKSALLPRVDATASWFDSNNDNADLNEYKLLLTQSLFNGAHWSNLSQAQWDIISAQWGYKQSIETLFISLASLYTETLIAKSEWELSLSNLNLSEKNHQIAQKSYEVGEKSYLDWLKSESDLIESQASVEDNEDTYQNNLNSLSRHINQPHRIKEVEEYTLNDFIEIPNHAHSLNSTHHQLSLSHLNAEVQQFTYRIRSAHQSIESAEWAYWPNVSLTAEIARRESGSEFTNNITVSESNRLGIQVNWNLFQGWGTDSQVNQAIANKEQLKYQLAQRLEDLDNEIYQLRTDIKQGKRRLESLMTVRNARKNALQVAQRSWELGVTDLSEVLTQRVELFTTEQSISRETHNYNLNWLKLYQLLGKISITKY